MRAIKLLLGNELIEGSNKVSIKSNGDLYVNELIEGGVEQNKTYTRPADWLPMPELVEGDQKIVGLHAVFNHDSNFCAFTVSGAYTVDWGDGTSDSYTSGATAYHIFNYADLGADTECSRGYRQAIVTITPQEGQNLTSINFNVKHNQIGLQDGYSTGWLDVKAVGANIDTLTFGSDARSAMLEIFEFVGSNSIANFSFMFDSCYSLQSIPQLDTSSGTNFSYMFYYCYSLSTGTLSGTSATISYSNCRLSRQALVDIFNGLATVTGQTITITSNWGAAELTEADRAIATDKGWTITG